MYDKKLKKVLQLKKKKKKLVKVKKITSPEKF